MNIAVFFPGIGYHVDKPLLYYTKMLAIKEGYEIKDVAYGGFDTGIKGDADKMMQAYQSALAQAEEILAEIAWEQYDEILFVSKSIGTAVAASYAGKHRLNTRNIFFTPVEQSFECMKDEGIIFTGLADPWVREGAVPAKSKEKGYPCYIYENANHSLETRDALTDLENLKDITKIVKNYIKK